MNVGCSPGASHPRALRARRVKRRILDGLSQVGIEQSAMTIAFDNVSVEVWDVMWDLSDHVNAKTPGI